MRSRQANAKLGRAFGVLSLALTAAAWFFLAPQHIGGPVVYTVITGQSMEPLLQTDDLVLVREQPDYRVGDAVAYRSRNLRQVVLHRIVSRDGDRFVMKGDNNDFLDGDQPLEEEILGKLWVRVPRAGVALTYLRSPVGMALTGVAILGILGFFSVSQRRRVRSGRRRRALGSGEPSAPESRAPRAIRAGSPRQERRRLQIVAAVLAVLLLVFGVLTVLALTWSPLRPAPRTIAYEHTGTFGYSAPAPGGPVYEDPVVGSGDPVFLRLVEEIEVTFDYALEAEVEGDVDVTGRMDAVVQSDTGWHRTIEIASARAPGHDRLHLSGRLDLARLTALVRSVEGLTGMAPGSYALSVRPEIRVTGAIGGEEVSDSFSPRLPFQLDDIQLTLARSEAEGVSQGLDDILEPRREETLEVQGLTPNPFTIAGRAVPLVAAQWVAAAGTVAMSLGLVFVAIVMRRRRPHDEAERIEARHGSLLIPVTEAPTVHQGTVDVNDIDTIVRLAQRFEQPILHHQRESDVHWYMVYYDGLMYRYGIAGREQIGR